MAYNFCRAIDDLADTTPLHPNRDSRLLAIEDGLRSGDDSEELVRHILPLINRYPETREPFARLVTACREDRPSLEICDERDLERYAYGVAGNVGLIMYPILGGTSPLGRSYAADLGIAMQYTNIARDILEDLARGRVYLPREWLAGCDPKGLLYRLPDTESGVTRAVRTLLSSAQQRYARGLSGIDYLARANRFAITVAARCYAAIGDRIIQNETLIRKRAVVPLSEKILIACAAGGAPLLRRSRARQDACDTAGVDGL